VKKAEDGLQSPRTLEIFEISLAVGKQRNVITTVALVANGSVSEFRGFI
jgi:hypothetical protein